MGKRGEEGERSYIKEFIFGLFGKLEDFLKMLVPSVRIPSSFLLFGSERGKEREGGGER